MLRKMFEEYTANINAIQALKADPCLVSDVVRGSSTEPPYGEHSIRVTGVDRLRKARNQKMITELEHSVGVVDALIDNLQPGRLKTTLSLKYRDGLSWEDVGAALGMDGDACRKQAVRWFNGK